MDDDPPIRVLIASDVSTRDGIGVEIYLGDELALEIFRDDTRKTRKVTFFKPDLSLNLVEESIAIFKREIPWDFMDDDETVDSDR